jgi:hypothetical protein
VNVDHGPFFGGEAHGIVQLGGGDGYSDRFGMDGFTINNVDGCSMIPSG